MAVPISQIHSIRQEYIKSELTEKEVHPDPIQQFTNWLNEALLAKVIEPSAMTIATANAKGMPSARIVLLKQVDEKGFVFYTNYDSHKGRDLAENNHIALLFFWPELERQVRIEGIVQKVPISVSESYFHSRPIGSQIGALASPQSMVIKSREELNERTNKLTEKYKEEIIPMPENWGGYLVIPHNIEFWQGRASRLHDRILYTHSTSGWKTTRLAP